MYNLIYNKTKLHVILDHYAIMSNCEIRLLDKMVFTILIPREAVSELLTLKLHVKSDWNKKLRLVGILMYCCRIKVIITRTHSETKLVKCMTVLVKTTQEDNYPVAESESLNAITYIKDMNIHHR